MLCFGEDRLFFSPLKGERGAAVINSALSVSMRSNDADGCKEYLALVTYK